jgi:hypothetical protein
MSPVAPPDRFSALSPADARNRLASGTERSSTFDELSNAAGALLRDHGERNAETVEPTVHGDALDFFAALLAILVRREPGTTEATVPAITDAQLLCTAPGFLPQQSVDPVDLTTVECLAALVSNGAGVSTGGDLDVR